MANPISKKVERIVVLKKVDGGGMLPQTIYERARKKKRKVTRVLRPMEKLQNEIVNANARAATDFQRRYAKARGKSKDGWLLDFDRNLFKAVRKGSKKMRIFRGL